MAKIDSYFRAMVEQKASDLHLVAGNPPAFRINGELRRVKGDPLDNAQVLALVEEILEDLQKKEFSETGDLDFMYEIEGSGRFRGNAYRQKFGAAAVFRLIPGDIPTCDQLDVPEPIRQLAHLRDGLVLVTGPTGSGKSTTLAAIIDLANATRKDNIITIEDPIEFVHRSKSCLISHRQIGDHTAGFTRALKAALREDPDIILVGEMRDLETIRLAIEASATGHLVFATLHTRSAIKTVDRIIEAFPAEEQSQVRSTLADGLQAVVAQTLLKRIDRPGRVAAHEIMLANNAISNLIREGKTYQLPSAIQTGRKQGMQALEGSLVALVEAKVIDPAEAYEKAVNKDALVPFLPQQRGVAA